MNLSNSAAGAVQLSSQSDVPTSSAIASQMPRYGAEPQRVPAISKAQAGGHCVTRRSVMNMISSTAAFAAVPAEALAKDIPQGGGPAQKPLNIENARPELRDAVKRFDATHSALMDADDVHRNAEARYIEWEIKNPPPSSPRAYRKWSRRAEKLYEELGLVPKEDALRKADGDYFAAQQKVAGLVALNSDELAVKSAASLMFEGALVEKTKHHLRGQKQIVAFSVAMDTLRLVAEADPYAKAQELRA